MKECDSLFGALLGFSVVGIMWILIFIVFMPGCFKAPVNELHYPPFAEPTPPEPDVFPDKGDVITAQHRESRLWLSTGCCDVLERRDGVLRLGPPCNGLLHGSSAWNFYSCIDGQSNVR